MVPAGLPMSGRSELDWAQAQVAMALNRAAATTPLILLIIRIEPVTTLDTPELQSKA
jgi:hypothetical protein